MADRRSEDAQRVGRRVRAARQAAGLSVGALAEAAGVGKGSLSELENGARNPTLSTLYALAGVLRTPLAGLLGETDGTASSPGIDVRLLDVTLLAEGTVETYRITLHPGSRHVSGSHGPGVVEHLTLIAGRARVGRTGALRTVAVGEHATWTSDVEHSFEALDGQTAEAVLVIRSPGPSRVEPRDQLSWSP